MITPVTNGEPKLGIVESSEPDPILWTPSLCCQRIPSPVSFRFVRTPVPVV